MTDPARQDFTQLTLGQRILLLRESQKLSLRTLANKVDLSASFLSQIERDETSPSIASLEKIALALGTDISGLFLRAHSEPLLRVADRLTSQIDGTEIQRLSQVDASLHPYRLLLKLHERMTALPSYNETFFYLLTGNLVITLGARDMALELGDTLHLSRQKQVLTLYNPGPNPTEVLAINYL